MHWYVWSMVYVYIYACECHLQLATLDIHKTDIPNHTQFGRLSLIESIAYS